jgi:predicted transcriptional regulator with HTH domain
MSHTVTDAERFWDYGMVDTDWVAFPICQPVKKEEWSSGQIKGLASYWNERNWILWHKVGKINYFTVKAFRSVPSDTSNTKGVTEGSETSITWGATFSTMHGEVEHISSEKGIKVVSNSGRRPHTWKIKPNQMCQVVPGQTIEECQILASGMPVLNDQELTCSGSLSDGLIQRLLNSREKPQRFTGIKLAKVNGFGEYCEKIREIVEDQEEDIYVRLEGPLTLH